MIRPPRHPVARLVAIVSPAVVLAIAVAQVVFSRVAGPSGPGRGPTVAVPRAGQSDWVVDHSRYVSRAMSGPAPVLFLGDSITRGWLGPALDGNDRRLNRLWLGRFASRRAANFGMDGDHVEHLLWRIRHGELPRIEPELIVLLIGTNNIGLDPPQEIAKGVVAVVDEIRRRCPGSLILVMGLLPRGTTLGHGQPPISLAPDPRIAAINRLLEPLADRPGVAFLDIGDRFIGPDGLLNRRLQPDLLHLSSEGYALWADALEPMVRLLVGPPPEREHASPGERPLRPGLASGSGSGSGPIDPDPAPHPGPPSG
ncbi:GDSL-type esterase/lipase family protein [Tautonia sociabilis]|uniref:GDSL family lipase n=1 Tax=Tautonia sociabilis TaxID=2080755 RepID=A0A432MDY4_9BACT|nr:GDSL-type esterase/lipase family protein [Tautonia sociabilis]RUL83306.1 GDSL family lipase [Tautonia sociabilis]